MKYNDLTKEEKKPYEAIAKKGRDWVVFNLNMLSKRRCFMCKYRFPNGVITKGKGLSGEYLFHMWSTHGLDPQDIVDIISKVTRVKHTMSSQYITTTD